VDAAEAGSSGVDPIRIGSLTLSASAWLESAEAVGHTTQELDAFRVRRARVGLSGSPTPRIGWNVSAETTDKAALRNAFVVLRFNDQLHVRAGQATPPSALERGTSPLVLELIDRSQVTRRLTPALDQAVTVMNDAPYRGWLSYAASIASGAGFNRRDDNAAKDVVGKLEITPPRARGLAVVISGSTGAQPTGVRTRTGLGFKYDVRAFKVSAEGLRQRIGADAAAQGFYAIGVYRIRPRAPRPHFRMVEVAARFVVMDDQAAARGTAAHTLDDDAGDTPAANGVPLTTREVQAGGSYYLNRNVRFMLNVTRPLDDRLDAGATAMSRLQLVF